MDEEILLTAEELARFLRINTQTVYNAISKEQEGTHIPKSIKIGRRRLWIKSEVLTWVKSIENECYHSPKENAVPLLPRIRRI